MGRNNLDHPKRNTIATSDETCHLSLAIDRFVSFHNFSFFVIHRALVMGDLGPVSGGRAGERDVAAGVGQLP